jgi:hypothetical protein
MQHLAPFTRELSDLRPQSAAVRILSPLTLISIESLAKIACGGHVC